MSAKKNFSKFELAGKLDEVLNLAPTAKIAKETLEIIAATYGLRCVPIGLPAGRQAVSLMGERDKNQAQPLAAPKPGTKRKEEEKSPPTVLIKDTRVSWRKHPEFIKLQKQHDDLVSQIRDPANSSTVHTIKDNMTIVEDEMRVFHEEVLRGAIPGVAPPPRQTVSKKHKHKNKTTSIEDVDMSQHSDGSAAAATAPAASPAPTLVVPVRASPVPSLASSAISGPAPGSVKALSARIDQVPTPPEGGGRSLRSRSKPRENPK